MDKLAIPNEWIVKRRLMDSQSGGGGGGGGGGGSSVGEVRRIHVIYFLSRKGRIEHPHLIRVHHLSRNGVHLRDVKRWLSELRGKDMAEAFSWSYKRRYKSGYVWQDLLDEDLITPISDNEYVLKGSEISSSSSTNNAIIRQGEAKVKIDQEHPQDPLMQESAQKSTEIDQESPPCSSETSTVTDESTKNEEQEEKTSKATKENDQMEKNSLYSTLLNKNKNKKTDTDNNSKASKDTIKKSSRNYSIGASNVFRNIITCGAIDTNDSAMVRVDRRDKTSLSTYTSKIIASITPEIRKGEERGGSERISGNVYSNLQQQQHQSGRKSWDGVKISRKNNSKSEFMSKQKTAAAIKTGNGPNCSQCGKPFKPEKLHQHMKSCKGIKAFSTKSPIPTSNILVKY